MTREDFHAQFSRREREIMDAIYHLGEAGASDVARHLEDDDGYDSIRVTLGILEKKGFLTHRRDGKRHIYRPTVSREEARRSAMSHLMSTFFHDSPSSAILAFLDMSSENLTSEDLDEIARHMEQASDKRK